MPNILDFFVMVLPQPDFKVLGVLLGLAGCPRML